MADSSFWGLKVSPNKEYAQIVDESFCVTMASLGPDAPESGKVSLMVLVGDKKEMCLCNLRPAHCENQKLDLRFNEGEKVTFRVTGSKMDVHLTGFVIPFDMGNMYDMDDASDSDDDSDDGEFMLDGSSDDDDDDEDEEIDSDDLDEEELRRAGAPFKNGKRVTKQGGVEIRELDEEESESEEEASSAAKEVKVAPKKKPNQQQQQQQNNSAKKRPNEDAAKAPSSATKKVKKEPKKEPKKEQAQTPKKKEQTPQQQKDTPKPQKSPLGEARKLAGGLIVQDVTLGKGALASNGKKCGMYYKGSLKSGKSFDSNLSGKPFMFKLGRGEVIKGWDLGVAGMRVGGRRRLTIPAHLGYGSQQIPGIPANSQLQFDIELKSVS